VESKSKSKYSIENMDEVTKRRIQKIIDSTRDFVQDLAEEGIDVVELAQVMISMSRETLVDAYGEYVADNYISQQISYLKTKENSLTLH
jgi:ABC-type uncharacterized transport system fused permease/ATPase subunit